MRRARLSVASIAVGVIPFTLGTLGTLGVLASLGAAYAQQPTPRVVNLQLPERQHVRDALGIDVDGDGLNDLVLIESGDAEPIARRLALHLQRRDGAAFSSEPDATLTLTPDVVAYAVADVHPDPGAEIVLFTAQAVFAWRWRAPESQRFAKLVDCDFLWQLADRKEAFHWQAGIVDLDRDGLADLALPFPGGWRIALQRRKDGAAHFDSTFDVHVPEDGRGGEGTLGRSRKTVVKSPNGRRSVTVSIESDSGLEMEAERIAGSPLVSVSDSVPAAQLVNRDGDGRLDIMCMSGAHVYVFPQRADGRFSDEDRIDLTNPVVADRSRELDVSYSARVLDLDGDGRTDCVIFAGDKRSKDVRTQALIFLQGPSRDANHTPGADPLFGAQGLPTQLLVFGGFARALGLEDVDGDGRPDLLVGAIEPDLIDELRTASTERIEAELYVYRNTGHGFTKRPDLTRKLSLPASNTAFSLDFVGDVDGDGMSEMLVREEKDRLRLYSTRRARDAWSVIEKPVWELAVEPPSPLLLPAVRGRGMRRVWGLGDTQVLWVSLR
jgi:hypothetical protein